MKYTITLQCLEVKCLTVLHTPLLTNRELAEPLFKGSQLRHLFHNQMHSSLELSFSPIGVERILSASFSWSQRLIVPLHLEVPGDV